MANYNLTAQQIKDTFGQLAQVSASIEGGVAGSGVLDGTGSRVTTLHATASNALNSVTSSFALTSTSASYAANGGVTSIIAGTNVTISPVGGKGAVTINSSGGGGSVDTGSLLVTASNVDATITYTKGDGSVFTNTINNVAFSTEAEDLVITVKNTSGGTLAKGTAVHAVGVTGQNVDVIAASNDSASAMPAIGLLSAELINNSAGTCIIAGRDKGLNTSGLVAGASVYVSTGGALTSTKPTGSALIQNIGTAAKIDGTDGEIIVQGSGRVNDLPNLANNYVWKGDANGVPQAVNQSTLSVASASYAVTSSHVTDPNIAYINKNNTFTGTQSFNNISVAGTGSFGYLQTVTGSAKIIGDAFIILNNDTPTQQYAGLVVQDSGSVLTTSSLQWDGGNNEWFLEYSDDGGVTAEHGIALFGPEYATKGSPTYLTNNKIPKSDGGHHLNDSSLTDNGSVVTATAKLVSTTELAVGQSTSPVNFPSSYLYLDTTGFGNGYSGYQIINQRSGSTALAGQLEMTTFSGLDGSNPIFGNKFNNNYLWWTSENYPEFNVARKLVAEQGMDLSGSIGINGSLTGSLNLNGAITSTGNITGNNITANGYLYSVAGAVTSGTGIQAGYAGSSGNIQIKNSSNGGLQFPSIEPFTNTTAYPSMYASLKIQDTNPTGSSPTQPVAMELTAFSGKDGVYPVSQFRLGPNEGVSGGNTVMWSSQNYPWVTFDKSVDFKSPVTSSAIISASAGIVAGATSNFNNVHLDGNLQVTGSLQYEGTSTGKHRTLSIVSSTASLDPSTGDYFTLTLVSGSNTVVNVGYADAGRGTTFVLECKQPSPAGGTISFINAKFPGGVAPTASPAGADIYTFVGINGGDSYGVQTANFI
jgi:hypothetical protein